jgi:hypothetical protein
MVYDSLTEVVAQLVEALCYKREGRGFDSRWWHWNLNAKLDKKRKIGRPKLRWFYYVQTDVRTLGINRWMYRAQDRQELARITREAKVKLKGP